jgi:predicted kinase
MPRLVVLNGPPAIGKSTVAGLYIRHHPLALNLDIDLVRNLLGRWRDDPQAAGLAARAIAVAAARTHLGAGHDVVVPQLLTRPELLDELAGVALELGATFHEVVLLDSRDNALRRFAERSRATVDPHHVQAHEMVERDGGEALLVAYHDRLLAFLADRPHATVLPSVAGDPVRTYESLLTLLDATGGSPG